MKFPFEIATLVAVPVLVACCVAPAFMAGLAATSLGWVAGVSALELTGTALGTMVFVFAVRRLKKTAKSKPLNVDGRIYNE